MSALVCDGCGRAASAQHIAARIERLEWATRFRPIHMQTLFLTEAPSERREEDYTALLDALSISAAARAKAEATDPEVSELVARLIEFQRRGFYLAFLVECPLDAQGLVTGNGEITLQSGSADLCNRFAPTLLKRIQFSYRPKQIVPLSAAIGRVVHVLQQAGLSDKLVLDQGAPFELARSAGSTNRNFTALREHLQTTDTPTAP